MSEKNKPVVPESLDSGSPKPGETPLSVSQARESLSASVRSLLSRPLPTGAEIVDFEGKPGGYIDDTFLLQPGDTGYYEGRGGSHQPEPLESEAEVAALLAAGAKDARLGPDARAEEEKNSKY